MKIFKLFLVIFLISSFNHLEASNYDVKSKDINSGNNLFFMFFFKKT